MQSSRCEYRCRLQEEGAAHVVDPWTLEAGSVGMASSKIVRAGERDDVLVVEAHAVEDEPEVLGGLGAVGQATSRRAL